MNEFERTDWEREEIHVPEPEAVPSPVEEPEDILAGETAPAEGPEAAWEDTAPTPEAAPREKEEAQIPPPASPESREIPFYQGNGYYNAPPQPPQGGTWQGPWGNIPQPPQGAPYGWQQPSMYPPPGWQGNSGPRTTGWQQPLPQWYGPAAWGQPPQQGPAPWQAGGYRPQGQPEQKKGGPVPSPWQGPDVPPEPKKKKRRVLRGFLILLGITAAVAVVTMAGYGIYTAVTGDNPLAKPDHSLLPPASSGGNSVPDVSLQDKPGDGTDLYDGSALDGGLSNAEIYKKVSPSVVAIVAGQGSGFSAQKGLGSGIIMSEDGYIITNAHLTENATDFEVILADGENSYKAQVVGSDTRNDLAVLKISASGLTPAEFGDSSQTEVGERVCVIGNPLALNFRNTLTVGYVSALNREVLVNERTINFIQTDAAINPGNSGGPLINAFGQVIGISSAKIVLPEYEGICFAIPISDAMPIVRELIANGKVTGRPVLGITAKAVKATEAEFYEIPMGLWVNSVNPGADIGSKGVREGDIITHINGQPVYTLDACSKILGEHDPGDMVTITVFRRESAIEDKNFTVEVQLQSS